MKLQSACIGYYESVFLWRRKVFTSIDELPVMRWWRIHETKDFSFLLKKGKRKTGKYKSLALNRIWVKVYDGYIDRFGFGEDYQAILEKECEIGRLRARKIESGDRAMNAFIKIAEAELEEMRRHNETGGKSSFLKTKAVVEKQMGFMMNPETTTTAEFYTYLSIVKSTIKNGSRGQDIE